MTVSRSTVRAGQAQAFAALTPVLPGHEEELRTFLQRLPGGKCPVIDAPQRPGKSPLNLADHHYARWLVISELHYNGPPQKPDVLRSPYLMYSACFDTMDLNQYLRRLAEHLGPYADQVWGHCVGYRGSPDLARYLTHNSIPLSVLFAEYPEASVAQVQAALQRRTDLAQFVVAIQQEKPPPPPAALRSKWNAFVATLGASER